MKKLALTAFMALLVSGCATSFSGSAKVDGPAQCSKICSNWNMDLAGMVSMGEYTDGCICKVKGENLSVSDIGKGLLMSSAGAAGGSVGVYRQMQESDR